MSYNNFGYPGYGYAPPAQSQQVPPAGFGGQQVQAPPATNKIYVVSAEDAMSRYAQPNTVMLYVQQDESAIYEVYTDGQGKKAIRARRLTDAPAENKGGSSGKYTEDELCMVANMLYSDYCSVIHPYISHEPEKEAQFYAKMAKAFLEDRDGPGPSEKLALYYYCIVEADD